MASKLTKTQINYLEWLYKGNAIHVSLECFSKLGEITYTSPLPFKADFRALDNLKRAGMLSFEDQIQYGLRWVVVSLSDRAVKFMEENP